MFPLFQLFRNIKIHPTHHNLGWISQFDSQLCHGCGQRSWPCPGVMLCTRTEVLGRATAQDRTVQPQGLHPLQEAVWAGNPLRITTPGPLHCFSHRFMVADHFFRPCHAPRDFMPPYDCLQDQPPHQCTQKHIGKGSPLLQAASYPMHFPSTPSSYPMRKSVGGFLSQTTVSDIQRPVSSFCTMNVITVLRMPGKVLG